MAAPLGKVLRVGVMQRGKIVDERIVAPRAPVTIGTAPGNTLALARADLPASTTVLAWQGDRYALVFPDGADGLVQPPQGAAAELAALVARGAARRHGGGWVVPVRDDDRGKLVLGDLTLLWHFVPARAGAPAPRLPVDTSGNRFRSLDRLFVTILLLSLGAHAGAYVALANAELPKEVTLEEIPDRYAKVLIPERLPQPPAPEERKPEAVAREEKPAADAPQATEKSQETPEQAARRKAARAAAVAKAVQSKGILKVLGALGPGAGGGAVADVFGSGAGIGDVATALSGAGGVAVATDPAAGGGRKGGGQGGAASIGDLATSGGGAVAYGAKAEVQVRVSGSVAAEEAEVDSADIDQQKLGTYVRARMGLIKACYDSALKRNPTLKGKISIRFTILETGGLADVTAALNSLASPEVASCIVSTMRAWRTQFRPSGPVTVEYPFVFSSAN
jgi:hypothetical protein